jgi:hypothetical protein
MRLPQPTVVPPPVTVVEANEEDKSPSTSSASIREPHPPTVSDMSVYEGPQHGHVETVHLDNVVLKPKAGYNDVALARAESTPAEPAQPTAPPVTVFVSNAVIVPDHV